MARSGACAKVEELTWEEVGEEIGTEKISVKNRWQHIKNNPPAWFE